MFAMNDNIWNARANGDFPVNSYALQSYRIIMRCYSGEVAMVPGVRIKRFVYLWISEFLWLKNVSRYDRNLT